MIVLGLVLVVVGLVTTTPFVTYLGTLVLVAGLVVIVLGQIGREVGGRKHFF